MTQLLLELGLHRIALRLLACSAVTYRVYRWQGLVGFVECAPLFGMALARPIIDLASGLGHAIRARACHPVEGRYFAFRGAPIDIVEDSDRRRWLKIADVRKVITRLPADKVLRQLYPGGLQPPNSKGTRIEAEALATCLQKASDPATLRFKRWLEREVRFPAKRSSAA